MKMILYPILKFLRFIFSGTSYLIKKIRKDVLRLNMDIYESQLYENYVELKDQVANDYCRETLELDKPCMISKFGTIELEALIQYKSIMQDHYSIKEYYEYIIKKRPTLWWEEGIDMLCKNAGFFPNEYNLLSKFYDIYIQAIKEIDILGSYIEEEKYFKEELKGAKRINIDGYYAPFFYKEPWTQVLKGKKVLVIHPFEKSIINQYKRRHLIWENNEILPEFELLTIKAEQTMLGQSSQYSSWFDALDSMKEKIDKMDFDIALIGCGAYGMPLAAYAKQLGKKAIHLAGWTQLLFGIKGKRWEDIPFVAKYFNENWVSPLPEEVPSNFKKVENGCYW